jgi:hypothetical protein
MHIREVEVGRSIVIERDASPSTTAGVGIATTPAGLHSPQAGNGIRLYFDSTTAATSTSKSTLSAIGGNSSVQYQARGRNSHQASTIPANSKIRTAATAWFVWIGI